MHTKAIAALPSLNIAISNAHSQVQHLPCSSTWCHKGTASNLHTLSPTPPYPIPHTPGRLQVVRTTHPPEFGPHGVASNPAPTYAKQPGMGWTAGSKKAVGPGAFNSPSHHMRPPSPARAGEG